MRHSGFSLVEVLIAASITSMVVLSVAQMQGTSLFSSRQARLMREATDIASSFIEELRAQPGNVPSLCANRETNGFSLSCSSTALSSNPASYQIRVQVGRNSRSYLDIQTILAVKP